MKKLLSLLLVTLLALGAFSGCGSSGSATPAAPAANGEPATPAAPAEPETNAEPVAPAEPVAEAQPVMDMIVTYPINNGVQPDTLLVQDEINKIITPKLNLNVELVSIAMGNYSTQMRLMLSSGEKVDLSVVRGSDYNSYLAADQLTDITDLVASYGQGIVDAIGESFLQAGKVNGRLYTVTTFRDLAVGHGGLNARKDMMTEAGYTEEDIKSMDDLDGLFAKVKELYPDMIPISNNAGGTLYATLGMSFDPLTDGFAVLRNFGEDLTVVNAFATDEYREYCEHVRRWFEAGYISADVAANTEAGVTLCKAGRIFSYVNRVKPGVANQETQMTGFNMAALQTLETATYTAVPQYFLWGVPHSAEDPARSIQYLNEVYTNADVMNLLTWGIEGKHYDKTADGHITKAAGLGDAESGYVSGMGWVFGNQYLTYVWEGDELDLYDQLRDFNNNAKQSKAFGFTFNNENVVTELAAIQGVYDQYKMGLECGVVDPAEALPKMLAEMEAAGMQKLIDEKQAQLDAWAAGA